MGERSQEGDPTANSTEPTTGGEGVRLNLSRISLENLRYSRHPLLRAHCARIRHQITEGSDPTARFDAAMPPENDPGR